MYSQFFGLPSYKLRRKETLSTQPGMFIVHWAAKAALQRPASEVILQHANLPLDCFCPVGLFLNQLEHFVPLFITRQRRHHLQKSLGMQFNHCSLDLQGGDYALKLFLHGP